MKQVRRPFARFCASWGFLFGKACDQAEFASPAFVDLPSFRHPQLALLSMPRCASVSGYYGIIRYNPRRGWLDG
ncbi:MAG TPA: hypothetical protein VFW40_04305 [Capsulimonadaceae bacterium]|nr:hypothetical protein [Capsulimonadaceae bacterium]